MQPSTLVPPVDLQIHPGQVPIGEHVDEAILPQRRVADLGSILICGGHGDLEVREDVGKIRRAAACCAQLPRGDHFWSGGQGRVDGKAAGGEDDGLDGVPGGNGADACVRLMLYKSNPCASLRPRLLVLLALPKMSNL